jgi:putative zinc finger/helix-turn-helix YgiT family protein
MKSPITGKEMILQREERKLTFRKEEFQVLYHYYLCADSGEQFTSTELDEINLNQLYNEYRQKYNLPFPDEIKSIREKYGLSAVKMSEALGFGVNVYRNYENGEVPNESNGKLLKLANDPRIFREIVEQSAVPGQKKKEVLLATIDTVRTEEKHSRFIIEKYLLGSDLPNELTGYKRPSLEILTEMVVFFTERIQPWKTKLNKLLFYADFACFRQTCFSISGIQYRAIDMGPVPNNFNSIFEYIANKDDVDVYRTEFPNGGLGEQFKSNPKRKFKQEVFTEPELKILNIIVETFASTSTEDIIQISHKEKAWKESFERGKQLISYKYGFELEAI